MLELYTWARGWPRPGGARIVELGVRTGNSTSAFLAACELGRGNLWSVDINTPEVPQEWHELPYWNFMKGHDMSIRVRDWAPPEIDVLFIDTGHGPETLDELRVWAPRVEPGGVILMHDTEDYCRQPPHHSDVWHALDDYAAEASNDDRVLEWHNRAGNHGLGVMRVR
jgi:predicted O-methyltransferase YrrM